MASLGEELLNVVNRLQDLVFNTIGNDSLDLPQIVGLPHPSRRTWWNASLGQFYLDSSAYTGLSR